MSSLDNISEEERYNNLSYLSGFGNTFSSEALPGALPKGQNNPQICPYNLYAEQLSGTSFTSSRYKNKFSWLYRLRPSVFHFQNLIPDENLSWKISNFSPNPNLPTHQGKEEYVAEPVQMRWNPPTLNSGEAKDFIEGIISMAKSGVEEGGCEIHLFCCNKSMNNKSFVNRDGDMLVVPQEGVLNVQTEFGLLRVEPTEVVVLQRGMIFKILLENNFSRGYILELKEGHFELPDLGPIGANGLANKRDFLSPTAAFQSKSAKEIISVKFGERFYKTSALTHSPFDVVGWHGNYVPFKYDLKLFCCMNSVTYDHPDPSIYTVLTAPSSSPGTAAVDFVIFPPRWMVMEHSFRPPWFHRNFMTEFMGLIYGDYDAKESNGKGGGFVPGGSSLHQCMAPHGPDFKSFQKAIGKQLEPEFFDKGLAFMFETCYPLRISRFGRFSDLRQENYVEDCWRDLDSNFDPNFKPTSDNNLIQWRNRSLNKSKL